VVRVTNSTLQTARSLAAAAAALFVVTLFFDWTHVTVSTPAVHISGGSSGWSGIGVAAGVVALVLLLYELRRLDSKADEGPLVVFLALGLLGFTLARFHDAATVNVTGVVGVDVGGRTWMAWVGLILATVAAGAAVAPFVDRLRSHGGTRAPAH
jgi:hypothetical protein